MSDCDDVARATLSLLVRTLDVLAKNGRITSEDIDEIFHLAALDHSSDKGTMPNRSVEAIIRKVKIDWL